MSVTRTRDRAKTRVARGYGANHRRLRRRWAKVVNAGGAKCARCGGPIVPGQPWDLGHDDHDRSRYVGPEHARAADCPEGGNRATGRRRKPSNRSREW